MNSKIYHGAVMHARTEPVRHSFRYPFYFYGFDLDELPRLDRSNRLFGYNRLRPVSLHDRDYLMPENGSIRDKLERLLREHDIEDPLGRVELVTAARYFNYVFNPVSFFYCYRPDEQLACVVTQVNNTFGDMHLYLLRDPQTEPDNGHYRFSDRKVFHVSPFFPRDGSYDFELTPPGEEIDIVLRYSIEDTLQLVARLNGTSRPLNSKNLATTLLRRPLGAAMTMPRILWQAARLHWQRRLSVYTRPNPASGMTVRVARPTAVDRIARRLVLGVFDRLAQGTLNVVMPDRTERRFGRGEPEARLEVLNNRFFRRVMYAADIGFGEAYTAGDWSSPDLPALLSLLAANETTLADRGLATAIGGRGLNLVRHLRRANSVRGSSRNIREHYDLSNDFFSIFLDPSMTYSCAIFDSEEDDLGQAQRNKLHHIIDKADISAADHVLEIGCGWGGFAIEVVRRTGCRVTGITVSEEQLALARQRVRDAGLEGQIDIRLCDYRHIEGRFDKIVSIEMLEAVGHAGLRPFFEACERALKPGGRAVIQVITIDDANYDAYRRSSDWIRKHIFPGGHLPSVAVMNDIVNRHTRLQPAGFETFGRHYALTLAAWRRTLLEESDRIGEIGFDATFLRKWEYYFAYCEAGFNTGKIDLVQLALDHPNESDRT